MKRISLIGVAVLSLSLTACGESKTPDKAASTPPSVVPRPTTAQQRNPNAPTAAAVSVALPTQAHASRRSKEDAAEDTPRAN